MDPEDENTSYLKYLNDSEAPNSFLLSNNVEDTFSVEPIFTTEWPSEGFPVLLSSPLITEDCSEASLEGNNQQLFVKQEKNGLEDGSDSNVDVEGIIPQESIVNLIGLNNKDEKTYINYSPIVKENADGNKEIYLTEKDINNDASIIQLLNVDGSVITIDKSILSSLNLSGNKGSTVDDFYTNVSAFKCKICSFLSENEDDIKNHIEKSHADEIKINNQSELNVSQQKMISLLNKNQNVNGETKSEYTVFVCSICKHVSSNKDEIKDHMITNHKLVKTEENCVVTTTEDPIVKKKKQDKEIKLSASLIIKRQQRALKKFRCTMQGCVVSFEKLEQREIHEKCHVGEHRKSFKCTQCDQKFSIWRICSDHMWKIHSIDVGLFTCPVCNSFKSNSSGRVISHMAIHNEEKPFLCTECGLRFKQLPQLKNHEALHKTPEEVPSWSKMKQCHLCHRYFANSKCLKKHIQSVHENFKPFICQICGHKTARKAMLELHLRQHTGAKPHGCPHCDYRTGDHNCLRKHIMKHMGTHKYSCPHCNYTCIQSASLKGHITNKHPGKSGTFSCKYCSYTTVNSAAWAAHEKCHEINLNKVSNSPEKSFSSTNNSVRKEIQADIDDDEIQNCFLNTDLSSEETVDRGGITIPAGFEMQLVS